MNDLVPNRPEAIVRAAAELEQRIVMRAQGIRQAWVGLASDLYEFHEDQIWSTLGYETLGHWLAQPEIDLSRTTFFHLVDAWGELVIERGVKPDLLTRVDMTKTKVIMPAIRRGEVSPEEALSDAEVLTRRDLADKYKDPAGEFHYENCPTCGHTIKVKDSVA